MLGFGAARCLSAMLAMQFRDHDLSILAASFEFLLQGVQSDLVGCLLEEAIIQHRLLLLQLAVVLGQRFWWGDL